MPKSRSYEQELMGYLQDPERAVAYLNAALEEGDADLFLVALQNVAKASGKEADLLERLKIVQPTSMDRTFHQLFLLLKELGLGLKPMELPKVS
ncbi:MAG: transcriptional regulator [Cyanobacteria bacterium RU_5_0]|nr:transcriptional regulator [Cyanobacteria bacterium RU_5_0]